jgi:hypothetical protein
MRGKDAIMKKSSFGTICGLTAAAVLAASLALAGCEDLLKALEKPTDKPPVQEVGSAADLKEAFESADVTEINITDSFNSALEFTVPAGATKVINIPGGKETAISSLKLEKNSHVTIAGPDIPAAAQSRMAATGAFAVARSETAGAAGPAILVIWDHFKIADGATFDLSGWVRLVFRSTATAEVNGKLTAEEEGSIVCTGGGENAAPTFTGTGTVKTGKDAVEKVAGNITAEDIPAAEGIELAYAEPPAEGGEGGQGPGEGGVDGTAVTLNGDPVTVVMDKGETHQFRAVGFSGTVTWSVTGTLEEAEDTKSEGTGISAGGLLTVAADETNITLVVKAATGGGEATATVKVKGWKLVESISSVFGTNGVQGVAYGAGKWVAAGSGGKIAYSSDGETWTAGTKTPDSAFLLNTVVYDGPEGGKKFIALEQRGKIYTSSDGVTWNNASWSKTNSNITLSFNGVAYGNDMFIAVATVQSGVDANRVGVNIATSTDGATWTLIDTPEGISNILEKKKSIFGGRGIAYGANKFVVALGQYAAIATTTNGTDMSRVANLPFTANSTDFSATGYTNSESPTMSSLYNVAFYSGQWILVGTDTSGSETTTMAVSTDTASWELIPFSLGMYPNSGKGIWQGNDKLFITGGTYGSSTVGRGKYTSGPVSADSTWTDLTLPEGDPTINAFAYIDNKFVIGGSTGRLFIAHGETLD